ncbi:2OG-Fe(II) oxygenase [Gilvimarinus sp. DA14]|uniref:2OG-Fe(II) oxygenase n=1 Tax=Gilvimarinus sp. DA14 TaxID=2956798 RepID=UPI0020B7F98E|nr:2OG-Fe(II) oxygenase [Gilvimarinus sp. DA14]UTF61057.1 2OG-Fe(II) oxygenase [Gilvimarinus sp. DA14]
MTISPLVHQKFTSRVDELFLDELADQLTEHGYAILDDVFCPAAVASLRAEFEHPDCRFKNAGIGRQEDFTIARQVRGDRICWLEGRTGAAAFFLDTMASIRHGLNRRLFMGLFDYESHLAYYPVGAFYKKHWDAFKGRSNRVLSTVFYLNQNWRESDGGELLLYDRADKTLMEAIVPQGGRLVVFLSEDFPHEVLPAHRERYSIAGWFRVNTSTATHLDPPE